MKICLLPQLATLPEHPESVPINALVAVAGTPLEVSSMPMLVSKISSCHASHSAGPQHGACRSQQDERLIRQGQQPVSGLELARVIATARITMPRSVVRLSAGRLNFSFADQARAAGRVKPAPSQDPPATCCRERQRALIECTDLQTDLWLIKEDKRRNFK